MYKHTRGFIYDAQIFIAIEKWYFSFIWLVQHTESFVISGATVNGTDGNVLYAIRHKRICFAGIILGVAATRFAAELRGI